MIVALFVSAVALVSITSAATTAEAIAKIPVTFRFKPDGASGAKIDVVYKEKQRVSYYLGDYTNGYSNPRFDHCIILDCMTEVRCTDYARYATDKNGEETECTMEHVKSDGCHMHSRLNTYDYFQQWWLTVYPDEVDIAVVQCYPKY